MFTWMKNLFPLLRKKTYAHTVYEDSIPGIDWDAYREEQDKREAQAKAEWETRNELEKKIDACYLGTRRQAFYGTYEEYQAEQSRMAYSQLSALSQYQRALLQSQQMQSMPYAQQFSGRGGMLGGIFG